MGCMSSIEYNRALAEAEATRKLKVANAETERRLGLQHITNLKSIHTSEASVEAEKKACELVVAEHAKLEANVHELQKRLAIPHTIVPTTQATHAIQDLRSLNTVKLAEIRTLADVERRLSFVKAVRDIEEVYAQQAFAIEKSYNSTLFSAEVQFAEALKALETAHLTRLVEEEAQAAVEKNIEEAQTPPFPDASAVGAEPPPLDLAEKEDERRNAVGFTTTRSFFEDLLLIVMILFSIFAIGTMMVATLAPKEFEEIRQIIIA